MLKKFICKMVFTKIEKLRNKQKKQSLRLNVTLENAFILSRKIITNKSISMVYLHHKINHMIYRIDDH